MLLILLSCVIALTPMLNRNFPKLIWVVINILWYVFAFIQQRPSRSVMMFILGLILWWGYELLLKEFGFSTASIGNYFILLCYFDIVCKAIYLLKCSDNVFKSLLLRCIQLVIIANLLHNIHLEDQIEGIHYYITIQPEIYGITNAGATEFYNVMIFFVPNCAFLFFKEKKNFWKVFDIICIVLTYYFMLSFETRATSLIMTSSLLIFVLLNQKVNGTFNLTKALLVMLVFYLIYKVSYVFLIESLPERVALRLRAIKEGDTGEGYTSRFDLIFRNVTTWFSSIDSFIFGVGNHIEGQKSLLLGNHSVFTDYIAKYGIIGLTFICLYIKNIYSLYLKFNCDIKTTTLIQIVLSFAVIIMIMTNSFNPENAVSTFLLTTLVISYNTSIKTI